MNNLKNKARAVRRRIAGSPDFATFNSHYREGDYRRAVFVGQDLVQIYPKSIEAKYKLALALSRDGQVLRSRALLVKMIESHGAEQRFVRALEVVENKIEAAHEWVKKQTVETAPVYGDAASGARGQKSPLWLQLRDLDASSARPSAEQLRRGAQLLLDMHSWSAAADRYKALMQTGKASQGDLKNCAKALIQSSRDEELPRLLDEINNMRKRAHQKPLDVIELAAAIGFPDYAVRDADIRLAESVTSSAELNRLQLRLREAGRVQDALKIGKVLSAVDDTAKIALRNGLYAEQILSYDDAVAEYAAALRGSVGAPSVAALHLARIIGRESGDETAARALLMAHGFWQVHDQDGSATRVLLSTLDGNDLELDPNAPTAVAIDRDALTLTSVCANKRDADEMSCRVQKEISRDWPRRWPTPGATASTQMRRRVALQFLERGSVQPAIDQALKILFSATSFEASDYGFIAYVLIRAGKLRSALSLLSVAEEVPSANRYQTPGASTRVRQVFRYLELCRSVPTNPDIFVWESHFGNRVDCNPYAIYREVRRRPGREHDIHVWVCNDPDTAPREVLGDPQTVITKRESWGYWAALALAGRLTNNASFPFEFVRREQQIYANTWHGTPLKALGRDDHDSPYDYGNVSRNFLHATDMLMPSSFTAEIMNERYCVEPISPADTHIVGQARNDILVGMSEADRAKIRESLGVPADEAFVLYAPTWRGGSKSSWFDTDRLARDLDVLGRSESFVLGFRGHPLALQHLDGMGVEPLIPDPSISTYELLAVADVLITDYSSLGVDFLCRERPVIYYVYDYEEYSATRGLYFTKDEFPGFTVSNIEDLLGAVKLAVRGELLSAEQLTAFRRKFSPLDDGMASARAANLLLRPCEVNNRKGNADGDLKPILMVHGLKNRDSLEAFIRTANHLAREERTVIVSFDHSAVASDHELHVVLDRISPDVCVIPRKGRIFEGADEYSSNATFNRRDRFVGDNGRDNYIRTARREANRLFGGTLFSTVIAWGIDSSLWVALCAEGVDAECRIACIDSNFAKTIESFEPWQARASHLLQGFDRVIVSDAGTHTYLRGSVGVRDVVTVDRREVGVPKVTPQRPLLPAQAVVVVGADESIDDLSAAVRSLEAEAELGLDIAQQVDVFVQGPARAHVADLLRSSFGSATTRVHADDFPYENVPRSQLLVDVTDRSVPSVAYLDARRAGVPAVWIGDVVQQDVPPSGRETELGRAIRASIASSPHPSEFELGFGHMSESLGIGRAFAKGA